MLRNKENTSSQTRGDRFIPTKVRSCAFNLQFDVPQSKDVSNYQQMLGKTILNTSSQLDSKKIMTFGAKKASQIQQKQNVRNRVQAQSLIMNKKHRKINKKPYKVLDAPNLQDDFYLNLIDWSSKNQIAVGLDSSLYIWSACSSQITKIYETNQISDYLCSVSFCEDNKLAFGNSFGQIKVYDIVKKKRVNNFEGHNGRVGSLDWSNGLLASGSRDGNVAVWDLRDGLVNKYKAHSQQICGLKWSNDGNFIASGGNDNKLTVHSNKTNSQFVTFHQHKAAVKAIGWCPSNPSILASGGGTADRHIRFFSTNSLSQNYAIDTGSQVCNLIFSKISNEMITTHGYSLNQINLWNTDANWEQSKSVKKMTTLTGHTYRVLYLALSPNGQSIITGAGDETLRFWKVFDNSQYMKENSLQYMVDLR